jgi:DNA replication protein DnaC
MMLDQVKNLSYHMRLFGIHEACERRASEALAQQLHPLEFLRLLLEDEVLSRQDRTAKALITKARFRFRADLEDLDLTFHKDLTKAKIKELSELSFLHNLENLLILGKTGLGKTHLAIALGKRLCQQGHPTQFLTVISCSKRSKPPRPPAVTSTTSVVSSKPRS